jgi:hypothetical protein
VNLRLLESNHSIARPWMTRPNYEVYIVTPTNISNENYDDFDGITHDN